MTTFVIERDLVEENDQELHCFDLDIVDDNLNYLSFYAPIQVPEYELHCIISALSEYGKTTLSKLLKRLEETPYDAIVLRQYIYALMFRDIIDFNIFEPLGPNSLIWVTESIDEMAL